MKPLGSLMVALVLIAVAGLGFVYSGFYPVSATEPHHKLTYWALETLRERSIARSAAGVEVPDLTDPQRLLTGGADYNDMCAGCHLKPGLSQTDMTLGLYPSPPDLSRSAEAHSHSHSGGAEDDVLRRQFWIIKHGIKASGMPAWGITHSDERIWSMVAFINALPAMDEMEYDIVTTRADSDAGQGHH